jgi:hypothetical protein
MRNSEAHFALISIARTALEADINLGIDAKQVRRCIEDMVAELMMLKNHLLQD